jgi:hypothetical protein
MHLGLCIPSDVDLQFLVGGENASWTEGKVTVFDDSFEHEIIFPATAATQSGGGSAAQPDRQEEAADHEENGKGEEEPPPTAMELIDTGRLVLLFDTWHPSLTADEIAAVRGTHTSPPPPHTTRPPGHTCPLSLVTLTVRSAPVHRTDRSLSGLICALVRRDWTGLAAAAGASSEDARACACEQP